MIKNFGGNYIDIGLIIGLDTREMTYYDNDDNIINYIIDVFTTGNNTPIGLSYKSKESRDNSADSIKNEEQHKEKGYIEGFKDGCEYSLKLKSKL